MTQIAHAYVGAQIHDGTDLHDGKALIVFRDGTTDIQDQGSLPADCAQQTLNGGLITPGFVDLQVNGGGGVMFNDDQSVEALDIIAHAHASTGTQALLPTLITDTPAQTRAAIDAVEQAIAQRIDGIAGLHLEGPHLSIARKGAHDPALIRQMEDDDLALMLNAAERIANLMVTVAPENVTNAQIRAMADAGIIVSLGHTDADFDTCMAAFDAGARCVTHLFNAMSQLGNREPGLVGATLQRDDIHAGLIADAIHVHPAAMRTALSAKPNSETVFLVTDAMATAGSDIDSFTINGRTVFRRDHKLTLADGTLAGADLEMPRALSIMTQQVGDSLTQAITRATATPASLLRDRNDLGRLGGANRTALYFEDGFRDPVVLNDGKQSVE
ncbi:N-acetylglucosamine-6-phosphate deacetylase [Marivita sp. S2033]|uniref:N-acetylglucosamine-6-phosphate deacetylase n=1 Tax=Marivita sp. S2033 TaxID=3373187 RepID=UPI003982BDC3